MSKPTAIDIFCGAGGVSEALKKHFKIVASVEYDEIIAKTYELNHGNEHLLIKDIKRISNKEWIDFTNLTVRDLDILVSTPPCQGFSKHSRKKAIENNDPRNKLILETCRIAEIFEPRFILFENVYNIINYKIFHSLIKRLSNVKKNGEKRSPNRPSYHLRFEIVDASDYNVPQKRKRLILIGKRIDTFPCKDAFIQSPNEKNPFVTNPLNIWPNKVKASLLGEYLSQFSLSKLKAGDTHKKDPFHTTRKLSALNLKRIKATPPNGGSRDSWPKDLILDCHKKKNVSFGDVYGRMNFYDYAPTITCGCISYSKGRFGHPIEDRAISLREAALIQTFPIHYKFTGHKNGQLFFGSKEKMATQIGNAVPVNLAKLFINEIYTHLKP